MLSNDVPVEEAIKAMEYKIKHLEFIQNTITRMSSNSFLLKGWTVTIIVGLFAFANSQEMDPTYITLALFPTLCFWLLDGFYLHQEKLYLALYNNVRMQNEGAIDFAMNASIYKGNVASWLRVCFSKTLRLFYIPVIVIIILAIWLLPHFAK
jgi:hypothetical protein